MTNVPGALKAALVSGCFDSVYIFTGDDQYLKEEAVRRVIVKATDPAIRDFNVDILRGGEFSASELDSFLATPPLMASRRVLVIRDAGLLKGPVLGVLNKYLAIPSVDMILLLLVQGKETRVGHFLEGRGTVVEFSQLLPAQTAKWIVEYVSTEFGGKISPRAVLLLQRSSGNDLQLLANELRKLESYTNGGEIDDTAINAVIGAQSTATLADLLNAAAIRDSAAILHLLPNLLTQPKVTGVFITMALAVQLLGIGYLRALLTQGVPVARARNELNILLKSSRPITGRPWGDVTECWTTASKVWNRLAVDRSVIALCDLDAALKEVSLSSVGQLLEGNLLIASTQ